MKVRIEPEICPHPSDIEEVWIDGEECVFVNASSRYVWTDGKHAVKFESNEHSQGIAQTMCEVAVWLSLDDEDRHYFAEIYDYGIVGNDFHYVVQKYISGRRDSCDMYYEELYDLFQKYNLIDLGDHQYFVTEDGPVLHDYGYIAHHARDKMMAA